MPSHFRHPAPIRLQIGLDAFWSVETKEQKGNSVQPNQRKARSRRKRKQGKTKLSPPKRARETTVMWKGGGATK